MTLMTEETSREEVEALAALAHTPLLGSMRIRLLLRHFGSAQAVLAADPAALAELPGFGTQVTASFATAQKERPWEQTLELVDRHEVTLLPFYDARYPKGLLDLTDYPVLLYMKGTLLPQDNNSLAVVGTRDATHYGKEMSAQISRQLATMGYTIVSGLARGIDTQAHEAALKANGRTIAFLGSGLSNIYPRECILLAEWITEQGALISEFPMLTPPDRQNFPQRNRLVATMSRATVLIEAPAKSGAMITVEKALAHKRPVFAIPGRADGDAFKGNHLLIKAKQAQFVENGRDIANALDNLFHAEPAGLTVSKPALVLDPEEQELLMTMPVEELSIDELVEKTKLPITKLHVLLMSLILKKLVKEFPGKLFKKLS